MIYVVNNFKMKILRLHYQVLLSTKKGQIYILLFKYGLSRFIELKQLYDIVELEVEDWKYDLIKQIVETSGGGGI